MVVPMSFFILLNIFGHVSGFVPAHPSHPQSQINVRTLMSTKLSASQGGFFGQLQAFFNPSTAGNVQSVTLGKERIDLTIYDKDIDECRTTLLAASKTKAEDPGAVVEALSSLEKLMRKKNTLDDCVTSRNTLKNLNGAWRLVFTTGTVDTQKKIGGRVNYFPLKAAQCFDTSSMTLTNGIYIGDLAVLKFYGPFEWNEKPRKLVFDFDQISVLGIKFNLPKGGAAQIGASTGLGSDNNVELVERGKKPFFNWISADDEIATARGGGGGLALWRRDLEMEKINEAEKTVQ